MPDNLTDSLNPVERLAFSYASPSGRPVWEAYHLFLHRLAETAQPGREPLLIQIRLSWWRDRLGEPSGRWPKGEPLLARLHMWEPEAAALIGLIDGWEAKVVGEDGGIALKAAQVEGYVSLARLLGETDLVSVRQVAEQFTERATVKGSTTPRLNRKMRPLAVLHKHAVRSESPGPSRPLSDFVVLTRVGLLGW